MTIPQYVGVTGIQNADLARQVIDLAQAQGFGPSFPHQLMLGALVSPSTLSGEPPVNTTMPCRHVANFAELLEVLEAAKQANVIGMLHMELGKEYPPQGGQSAAVITLLQSVQREGISPPIQLNGCITPDDVARIYQATGTPIVWQLRREFMQAGEQAMLEYARSVADSISMVLLDASAGSGEAIDVRAAVSLQRCIERELAGRFTFGYAGGLGPDADTIAIIRQVKSALLNSDRFSVDAESRVRAATAAQTGDQLSPPLCESYFSRVREGLQS